MNTQRLLLALTVANLALVGFLLWKVSTVSKRIDGTVLRGKSLEIVDDAGRVRAGIWVMPQDEKYRTEDGGPWPETVLLRLINENGGPNVKLAATTRGAGLLLGGSDGNPTYIQLKSEGTQTAVKLLNADGKEQVLKP